MALRTTTTSGGFKITDTETNNTVSVQVDSNGSPKNIAVATSSGAKISASKNGDFTASIGIFSGSKTSTETGANYGISVGPVSYAQHPDGSYTASADLSGLGTYTTTGDSFGNVTSTNLSFGNEYAGFGIRTETDANGNSIVTESAHIHIPGIPGISDGFDYDYNHSGDPRDPNTVADSWPGRFVNAFTFGLVDKIRDRRRIIDEAAEINEATRDNFNTAQRPPRRDPLTLDLDNDGIETIAASSANPILFDHDGDGIKTGTGWISPDDGFLALDRNGNGAIDNGTELFGDATSLTTTFASGSSYTYKAADGFTALKAEDTNHDGKVDSADANWNQLRVWRDLNQDGISQTNELFTLDALGIAGINVAKTANSQTLANGNQIADLGTFIRSDGSQGTLGEVDQMADVNLFDDTFHREFPDHIPLADGVAALPEMQGSGQVRDLHEAASQSAELKDLLTQFSQATTRQE